MEGRGIRVVIMVVNTIVGLGSAVRMTVPTLLTVRCDGGVNNE
jgi:hypothetical protein